jgi:hypothetical protein
MKKKTKIKNKKYLISDTTIREKQVNRLRLITFCCLFTVLKKKYSKYKNNFHLYFTSQYFFQKKKKKYILKHINDIVITGTLEYNHIYGVHWHLRCFFKQIYNVKSCTLLNVLILNSNYKINSIHFI